MSVMVKMDELQQKKLEQMMQAQIKEYQSELSSIIGSKFFFALAGVAGWAFILLCSGADRSTATEIGAFCCAINMLSLGLMYPPYVLPSAQSKYRKNTYNWLAMDKLPVSKAQIAYYSLHKKWRACVTCMAIAAVGQILLVLLLHKGNLFVGLLAAGCVYLVLPLGPDACSILFAKK